MTPLTMLVWLAVAGTALAAVVTGAAVPRRALEPWARRTQHVALAAVALPLAALAVLQLRADVDTFYVWEHTRTDYAWWLRLAGVWGGQEGTFLLWAFIVLAAASLEARRASDATWPHARATLMALSLLLVLPAALLGLGAATDVYGLAPSGTFERGAAGPSPLDLRPDGQGLNPLLETVYMAIHPPIEFLAYALAALPFAYALAHLARGGAYRDACMRWARPAFLAFTLALGLGALWAYNVLSFGGYWAWDPVEVAALLPLVALAIFLHASHVAKKGHLGLLAPGAAAVAFVLVVFATFVTRTGLWASVHAFLPTGVVAGITDPGDRLVAIIDADLSARYSTGLLLAVTGVVSAAACLFHARRLKYEPRFAGFARACAGFYAGVAILGLAFPEGIAIGLTRLANVLGAGATLPGAMVLLVLAAAPLLLGLAAAPRDTPTSPKEKAGQLTLASYVLLLTLLATLALLVLGVNGSDASVYDARAPFLAAPVLALTSLAFHALPFRRRLEILGGAALLSAALGLAFGSWAWAAAPLALASFIGPLLLLAERMHAGQGKRARTRALLLVISGILGLVQWTSPGTLLLGGSAWTAPVVLVPLGLLASGTALLAPLLERHARFPSWVGALAGVLAVGYGVGALAAIASIAVHPRRVAGARPALKKAGVPLIHVGLALLVAGVAFSTYEAHTWSFPRDQALVRGAPVGVGAYELELVEGRVLDEDDDGRPERVEAIVHVTRGGAFVSEERLVLAHSPNAGLTVAGAYVPTHSPIARGPFRDLVLNGDTRTPLAILVRGDADTWIVANGPPPEAVEGDVAAIAMGAKAMPGVNLVWTGIVLILVGLWVRTQAPWRKPAEPPIRAG